MKTILLLQTADTQNNTLKIVKKIGYRYFLDNAYKLIYKIKPPSIDEFLSTKYLGGAGGNEIYPHIKRVLKDYLNPLSGKNLLALVTCIRYGKSFCSALIAIFVIIRLSYMFNYKSFYNLNIAGSVAISFLSFTQLKSKQILLQPFSRLLDASPIFHKTMREDQVQIKQEQIPEGHIAFTSAGKMGSFQFSSDIHIIVQSEKSALLGLNIILGIASEINFWSYKGVTPDEIWETFLDLRGRVQSRFGDRYLSGVILDSSPLDLSLSPIDKWIWTGQAEQDPRVMVVKARHWDVFPEQYHRWNKNRNLVFKVYRGSTAKPPRVLSEGEENNYSIDDIIPVPIDKKVDFKNNLKKSIADYCGYPAGGLSRLFDDLDKVEEIFSPQLNNVYSFITASSNEPPEDLIWDKVSKLFFINIGNRYIFYRAPNAPRTIHLDLAETGDLAGVGMSHMEINSEGKNIAIVDFSIAISPHKSRINLDAISDFIIALRDKGHINIKLVTADQYQSSSILQKLERDMIKTSLFSVDRDVTPYRVVVSWILNGRVKVGKNIILKNNLLSLLEIQSDNGKVKIEHTSGQVVYEDSGEWNKSLMGVNAKDISDAVVGSVYNTIQLTENKIPAYQWMDDEKENNDLDENDIEEEPEEKIILSYEELEKQFIKEKQERHQRRVDKIENKKTHHQRRIEAEIRENNKLKEVLSDKEIILKNGYISLHPIEEENNNSSIESKELLKKIYERYHLVPAKNNI